MNRVKLFAVLAFIAGITGGLAIQSAAYPQFLAQSKKFGAKDCRFCHVKAEGGEPFNTRGKWLIKEKERRNADSVDPEWLADYKAGKSKK